MTKLIVDGLTLAKLGNLAQSLELCDHSGRTLGFFTPAEDRSLYVGVEPPISDDELEQRQRKGGGRTLDEIIADLEKRA